MSSVDPNPFGREYNPFAAPETNDFAVAANGGDPSQAAAAGRLTRLGAAILDGILMLPVGIVVIMTVHGGFNAVMRRGGLDPEKELQGSLVGLVAGIIWYVIMNGFLLSTRGQSIGKLAAGIRIVDFQSGGKASFGQVFWRRYFVMQLIYVIPLVGGLIALVGILLIFRSNQRCLHDEIAGTRVVMAT